MKKLLLLIVSMLFSLAALAAVNINTATKEELDALKGIGPVKAQAIVDYRKEHGPFKSVDDLKNVKGIGDKTLESLRKDISVSGANTAPAAAPAKSETKSAAKDSKAADAKPAEAKPAAKSEAKPAETKPAADAKKDDKAAKKDDAKKDDAKKDDTKKSAKKSKKDDDAKKDDSKK
jgi:competence protein ComEA